MRGTYSRVTGRTKSGWAAGHRHGADYGAARYQPARYGGLLHLRPPVSQIVSLRPDGVVPETQGEPTVVEMLEDWLAMARRGEVTAIAIAGVKPNGRVTTSFNNPAQWYHHLVSGAATLMHRLVE